MSHSAFCSLGGSTTNIISYGLWQIWGIDIQWFKCTFLELRLQPSPSLNLRHMIGLYAPWGTPYQMPFRVIKHLHASVGLFLLIVTMTPYSCFLYLFMAMDSRCCCVFCWLPNRLIVPRNWLVHISAIHLEWSWLGERTVGLQSKAQHQERKKGRRWMVVFDQGNLVIIQSRSQ